MFYVKTTDNRVLNHFFGWLRLQIKRHSSTTPKRYKGGFSGFHEIVKVREIFKDFVRLYKYRQMVKYTCETCQKVFSQKGHLEDHHNRKRPCKKDNTIEALVEKKVQEALSKTNEGTIKTDSTTTSITQSNHMDYSTKTREELIAICKEKNIKGYSGKKKDDILKLIQDKEPNQTDFVESEVCCVL